MQNYRTRVLEKLSNLVDSDTAESIEQEIYLYIVEISDVPEDWSDKRFYSQYLGKSRSIITNLNSDGYIHNTSLINHVKEGTVTPRELARMSPQEMHPDQWKEIIDKRLNEIDKIVHYKPTASTNLYKCGKCKGRECTFYQEQTRSCDEPMTTFITCLNPSCNNRWKQ